MVKQYFSFGCGHALSGFHVEIEGETAMDCRNTMVELFGTCWGFQYDEVPEVNNTIPLPLKKNQYGELKLMKEDVGA